MWLVGMVIGFVFYVVIRQIKIQENRKDCAYDPETNCWHKVF